MNDDISGYNDWQDAFENWTDISISELHGLMTAVMVACQPADVQTWSLLLDELSFAPPEPDALELLHQYATDVSFALKDQEDDYEPLLPDDDHDLSERFLALKNWAGGFITGLGVAEVSLGTDEQELIKMLAQIASIRPSDDGQFDGDELEFLELFEFARMIPISLYCKNRKNIKELSIIKGLSPDRLTAKELQTYNLPEVFDVMKRQ